MNGGIHLLPESASTFSGESNALFYTLMAFSSGLGSFLSFLILRYAIIYRRGSSTPRTGRRARNPWLEAAWTGAATIVAFGIFAWGADLYVEREEPPANALRVAGIGKQWMWTFEHPGGQREINELHVPVDRPVIVELGSQDVIHSFFVPAFRVKQDAVPGMATSVWFEATKPGEYNLFCAEFCGTQHAKMQGLVVAMPQAEYATWLDGQPHGSDLAAQGERLFRALGCSGCHDGNGTVRAPDLHGLFGRPVALADGTTVTADMQYVRDSILIPKKQIVAGYEPVMPAFAGLIEEDALMRLIAYIRSLQDEGAHS